MRLTGDSLESYFAVTAPGLEALTAQELTALGASPQVIEGGVLFSGDLDLLYRANLQLRTASRILMRISSFEALSFYDLEIQAKKIAWSRWISGEGFVSFRVSCHKSKLYHSGAVKERFEKSIQKATSAKISTKSDDDEEAHDEQLFFVRFAHDKCTVSVDTSGALLHQRGYRQATAKAPLRETLAAAMLLASQWDPKTPLIDPMCGSGTIAIEAALLARDIAPGVASTTPRRYAFQGWSHFDAVLWEQLITQARGRILPQKNALIFAADQSAGAIEASTSNAARAGVTEDITFEKKPLASWTSRQEKRGLWLSNPPYGHRVGNLQDLRALYQEIGRTARTHFQGWRLGLLVAGPQMLSQVGLQFQEALRTKNGGISVQLMTAQIPQKNYRRS